MSTVRHVRGVVLSCWNLTTSRAEIPAFSLDLFGFPELVNLAQSKWFVTVSKLLLKKVEISRCQLPHESIYQQTNNIQRLPSMYRSQRYKFHYCALQIVSSCLHLHVILRIHYDDVRYTLTTTSKGRHCKVRHTRTNQFISTGRKTSGHITSLISW